MKSRDVGIDSGTTSVIVYVAGKGIVMTEPSVVAVNTETDDVIAVGKQAYDMDWENTQQNPGHSAQ